MEENLDEHKTLVDVFFSKTANPVGNTRGKRGLGPEGNSDSPEHGWGGLGSRRRLTRALWRQGFGGCLPPVCTAPWDGAWCLLSCCVRMGHLLPPCTVYTGRDLHPGSHVATKSPLGCSGDGGRWSPGVLRTLR